MGSLTKTNPSAETLIVWTEANGTDMALSFQEADGCAAIWFVTESDSTPAQAHPSNT
jgi:hypothetical protein